MAPSQLRPEHPRPQFVRQNWLNLNGPWTFVLDNSHSGSERGLQHSTGFDREIMVPFCPESRLSGVAHTDFIEEMWYHRAVRIPDAWAGTKTLLHFGGVDYESEIFVDGQLVGTHRGGTVSFRLDITRFVKVGQDQHLVMHVKDNLRAGRQPSGKQSPVFKSAGCHYTRTTGIWQTVWLEQAHSFGIDNVAIVPDLDRSAFVFTPTFHAVHPSNRMRIRIQASGAVVADTTAPAVNGVPVCVPVSGARPWSPSDPFLYDVTFDVIDGGGKVSDTVASYGGLRKIHIDGNRLFLNNEPLYLRLVLDQGFYPDGIWTAPTDEALRRDIELSMQAGFNGARLHQKVFEERFHYWADKLGYLTWGESASWGFDMCSGDGAWNFMAEWREIVVRDRSHPSIIAWTPFNETGTQVDKSRHDQRLVLDTYGLTASLDPTRPVNDCSGWVHTKTDLWTVHDYAQDHATLAKNLKPDTERGVMRNQPKLEPPYEGQPYLVDEFGGVKWIPEGRRAFADNSWGYGDAPKSEQEVYARLEGLVKAIRGHEHISGFCYTQLTDVEQEQNGIYNYDRSPKFDMARVRRIFSS